MNDKADGRRNMVSLSPKGKEIVEKIQDQYKDVNSAVEDLSLNTEMISGKLSGNGNFYWSRSRSFAG